MYEKLNFQLTHVIPSLFFYWIYEKLSTVIQSKTMTCIVRITARKCEFASA